VARDSGICYQTNSGGRKLARRRATSPMRPPPRPGIPPPSWRANLHTSSSRPCDLDASAAFELVVGVNAEGSCLLFQRAASLQGSLSGTAETVCAVPNRGLCSKKDLMQTDGTSPISSKTAATSSTNPATPAHKSTFPVELLPCPARRSVLPFDSSTSGVADL
jgi:hypothetical protein